MVVMLDRYRSPLGDLLLASRDGVLSILEFADNRSRWEALLARILAPDEACKEGPMEAVTAPLTGYFTGDIAALDAIPVRPFGTSFQQACWRCLRAIPYGTTLSYGGLAKILGRPRSARAVGAANALNPISIIIPCHRLVGAQGALTGYAGGIDRKKWLLEHEGVQFDQIHRPVHAMNC